MAVGAWFGLIYVWGKNIWFNIFSHFFFDVITPLAALALLVVTLITQ
jgi:membrane protease YdiL (CAAX protease family)